MDAEQNTNDQSTSNQPSTSALNNSNGIKAPKIWTYGKLYALAERVVNDPVDAKSRIPFGLDTNQGEQESNPDNINPVVAQMMGLNFYRQFIDVHSAKHRNKQQLEVPAETVYINKEARDTYWEKEIDRLNVVEAMMNGQFDEKFASTPSALTEFAFTLDPPQRPIQYAAICECQTTASKIKELIPRLSEIPEVDQPVLTIFENGELACELEDMEIYYKLNAEGEKIKDELKCSVMKYISNRCMSGAKRYRTIGNWDMYEVSVSYFHFDCYLEHFYKRIARYLLSSSKTAQHIFHHTDIVLQLIKTESELAASGQVTNCGIYPKIMTEIQCIFRHLYRINLHTYFVELVSDANYMVISTNSKFGKILRKFWQYSKKLELPPNVQEQQKLVTRCAYYFGEGCRRVYGRDPNINCSDCIKSWSESTNYKCTFFDDEKS